MVYSVGPFEAGDEEETNDVSDSRETDPAAREHPNATAYRRTADAFRARDLAALAALFDPDAVWHIPGQSFRAGEIRGLEAIIALLRGLPAGFTIREHDVLGNDEHVVALSHIGVLRPDLELETRVVNVFHFRDGRQVERWFYPDDADVWDRIFGLPAYR
ncbi:MAG: nuclear transport factor 2 family protein [Chloroflexota bacterium]